MDDAHRLAAQHVGRPQHDRIAQPLDLGEELLGVAADVVRRLAEPEAAQQLLEALAVLGEIDRVGRGAEDRHAGIGQRLGELERRLAAELHDHADELARARLDADDLEHVLGGQRLEVEAVRGVVVGRDGLGVAVDHDRLEAGLGEREGGVHAAVVELDALADAVGPAAEDHDLAPRARPGLAFGGLVVAETRLVAAVEIGRARLELGRAGVDPLEHRVHAQRLAARRDRGLLAARQAGEAGIGEAHRLELEPALGILGQAACLHLLLGQHDAADLLEEPGIVMTGGLDLADVEPGAERLGDHPDAVGGRPAERRADRVLRPLLVGQALDLELVEPVEPGLERAQRLLQRIPRSCGRAP